MKFIKKNTGSLPSKRYQKGVSSRLRKQIKYNIFYKFIRVQQARNIPRKQEAKEIKEDNLH